MTNEPDTTSTPLRAASRSRAAVTMAATLVLLGAAGVMFLLQVRVVDHDTGTTRACGSGFDSAVDRSGWEQWWRADLDEPESTVRSSLPRTRLCPGAVNQRTAIAGLLAAAGTSTAALHAWRRRRDRDRSVQRSMTGNRLKLLGRSTAFAGGGLVLSGLVAIIVVVADSEALVFRYVDRSVVFIVGLLVLTPALIMVAFGLAVSFVGDDVDRPHRDA